MSYLLTKKSKVMENALDDWAKALAGRSKKCGLVEYKMVSKS